MRPTTLRVRWRGAAGWPGRPRAAALPRGPSIGHPMERAGAVSRHRASGWLRSERGAVLGVRTRRGPSPARSLVLENPAAGPEHQRVLRWVVRRLKSFGYAVRAGVLRTPPSPLLYVPGQERPRRPDAVAWHPCGRNVLVEVETGESIGSQHTHGQLEDLSTYRAETGDEVVLVVPEHAVKAARRNLLRWDLSGSIRLLIVPGCRS